MAKISISDWFTRKRRPKTTHPRVDGERLDIPEDLWVKCHKCEAAIFNRELEENLKVCPKCNYHFKLSANERLFYMLDRETFVEHDSKVKSKDFLQFVDTMPYNKRLEDAHLKSGLNDVIICGEGKINGHQVAIGVMDFSFMGGSMGSVVGEKISRLIELAIEKKTAVIIFTASGGARMQEGIMSLMQMAKTSAALGRLREQKLPYICVHTDPTTAGVSASFAMLGDIQLAEPGALIGFTGPRVIEQTIRQKLPPGFQRAEYLVEHGMVDTVVHRKDLRDTLTKVLAFFKG